MGLNFYFPRIYRKITAIIIFLGITLITINIFHSRLFGEDEEKRLQQDVVGNPSDSLAHEKLAQYYLEINSEAAQREYALAQDLYQYSSSPPSQVAGAKSSPWQTWLAIISTREKLLREVKYWQVVQTHLPDYRYANLKLAVLYYQLGEKDNSDKYLQNVLHEDPTNSTVLLLLSKMK